MNNEEIQEKFEQLASAIDWIKTKLVDLQEERGLAPVKTSYEVEVPEDIDDCYTTGIYGIVDRLENFSTPYKEGCYKRGLIFKTREQAEQHDKELILLFKLHKWAEEHNGGWMPDWNDDDETIYEVQIDRFPMYGCDSPLVINEVDEVRSVSIFPYFYSYETAREFIEEFRGEIEEVFC
nr:MAG TPA: hypothetical protein [Caudoviricetes sp.]